MSFNLLRNSRVFFTTNVGTSGNQIGVVQATGFTSGNTKEIQVLDGFGFSQNTTSETVTLSETGAVPVRGQRTFNTQLDPVDFNMTTYIRPFKDTSGGVVTSFSWGATTGAVTAGSGASTTLLDAYPANIVTASAATQAFAADFGLNTFVYATSAPAAGKTATFAPIFGADSTTPSYQKLIGIYLVNGGSGYTVAPTVTIVDPDSGAEATALPVVTTVISAAGTTTITAEESDLWNAFFTSSATGATQAWTETSASAELVSDYSQAHQLKRFGLIVVMDTACFVIDDCVLNTATIDFGIDAIASVQWAGQAKGIRQINAPGLGTVGTFTASGLGTPTISGNYKQKITTAAFIANKLSTFSLLSGLGSPGTPPGGTPTYYNLPITGGSLTLSNNVSYLTPANLGIVNTPVTYFAGTRAISGSVTAYLRSGAATGANDTSDPTTGRKQTAQLLGDLLTGSTTTVDPRFYMKLIIGGTTADDRVEIEMPGVVLTIPTIATEQVVSTSINFTAQGTDTISAIREFDLEEANEINIKYYAG
jgi:hypothetical protein